VPSLPRFPLELRAEVNHEETRVMGLSYSEDRMIVACHFDTVPACDGRTDGRTDRQRDGQTDGFTIANTALCTERYADEL